jgi:hypothetical protein
MAKRNTIIFILSARRSGSTWVGYVLGAARNCAFLGEYYRAWNEFLRQPCSWCTARGINPCPVLDGAENVPVDKAFQFAFSRTDAHTLVDSSKVLDWIERFTGIASEFDVKAIHVLRDPRGFCESERRRSPLPLDALASLWVEENAAIRQFLERRSIQSVSVFYDDLALRPEIEFKNLYRQLGMDFDPAYLRYWEKPQHGFAANGASSPLLFDCTNTENFEQFITGDDSFYRTNQKKPFYDTRWQQKLSPEEIDQIRNRTEITDILRQYSRGLSDTGLKQIGK